MRDNDKENKNVINNPLFATDKQETEVKITKKERICGLIVGVFVFALFIFILFLPYVLSPKISKELRQEIIDTFAGFENRGEVVFVHDYIFLPDKKIEYRELQYNGEEMDSVIGCGADSFYTFTKEKIDKKLVTINLLEVGYKDNEIKLLCTLSDLPNSNWIKTHYLQNKLYLGTFDGEYYVYDLATKTLTTMPESDFDIFKEDQNQYKYEIIEKNFLFHIKESGVQITSKSTGEVKIVTKDRLNDFTEGQYVLSLDPYLGDRFYKAATEKDGYIYILIMIRLENHFFSGHQNVVLKYDFENDILSYYSSMLYPWDEIPQMTIL